MTPQRTQQVLTRLAIGLLQLEHAHPDQRISSVSLLNPHIKQAWEYICLSGYLHQHDFPQTLPDFVLWLYSPVEHWPVIGTHCEELGLVGAVLHDDGIALPFRAMGERFASTYNPRLELEDDHFRQIFEVCRQHGDELSYREIRTFLIRNPVHPDLYAVEDALWDNSLTALFLRCYEPIAEASVRGSRGQRYIVQCPHCGWALRWNKKNEARCHRDGICAHLYAPLSDAEADDLYRMEYHEGIAQTREGIQRYVVAPEVSLMEIHDTLQREWNIQCESFPGVDSYDLLLVLPDGERWAVDVKDWSSAVSLAVGVSETPFQYYPV
ncbi:MAG: hypothetical protein AAF653_20380 [Chloroflexota bacterium]